MRLVIANKLYSSWSLRPWILMREKGIVFEETVIPLRKPDTKERIRSFSAAGKCPVLIDGDVTVWESLAIVEYLAEKYPELRIWPADAKARAHARAVSNEMHAGFQPLRAACPMNLGKRFAPREFGADVATSVARIEELWREARSRFGAEGPFLYGAFSAADAMFAPVVTRLDTYRIGVSPDTRAYMDEVLRTPSFRDWLAGALGEPADWHIPDYEDGHTADEVIARQR